MPRILIVDDDEGLLSIIGEYLSAFGFEPEHAASAAQARDCLMRSKYAAVLSDFQMPGESGLDLLIHVKSRYPDLPYVMMTGAQNSRLKYEAIKMGSNGYITKPFQLNELLKAIAAVLAPVDQQTEKSAS